MFLIEEAFFLTRGNIGKELDIHLRKALGILNNNEMEIEQLCTAFRKEGKQLNRVVHKASTMKKVFKRIGAWFKGLWKRYLAFRNRQDDWARMSDQDKRLMKIVTDFQAWLRDRTPEAG